MSQSLMGRAAAHYWSYVVLGLSMSEAQSKHKGAETFMRCPRPTWLRGLRVYYFVGALFSPGSKKTIEQHNIISSPF